MKVKRGETAANPTAGLEDLDELARPERPRQRALSDGDVLVFASTKSEQPHRLPLSAAALAI